jgi:glycosyltransferase involved in cell wall biosynthesis
MGRQSRPVARRRPPADTLAAVRVLVVTNLYPDSDSARRGRFVRDQVEALRGLGVDLELFTFSLGARSYLRAVGPLRRLLRHEPFDVVHAHYGLCGWTAARAGARPLIVTFHGTDVRHRVAGVISRRLTRRIALAAGVSGSIFGEQGGRPGLPLRGGRAVLPCGVDLGRFKPRARAEARSRLGLPDGRYLLFPADPSRPVKRGERAAEVARLSGAELLTAGEIDPERMPDYVNAASAVLITSDSEGFGLAALEALACRVPVLSTPVGVVPLALEGVEGCLVAPYDAERWAALARRHLDAGDARTPDAWAAEAFSAERMARRVLAAYQGVAA